MGGNAGRFTGKVAIVTGGGDRGDLDGVGLGVGATICDRLASEGAAVGVLDRDLELAMATSARIEAAGGTAVPVAADVSSSDDCRTAVEEVTRALGGIDVLVNNVGVESYPRRQDSGLLLPPMIPDIAEEDWDRTMAVNVKGMVLMAKYVAPHFRGHASIVCISSTGAMRPAKGTAAYATSKGAVLTLTMAMAIELAPVRVNCVSPGQVWTPAARRKLPDGMVETIRHERAARSLLGSEGTALDIASAVAFLASDDARWITGQNLTVDGGATINSRDSARTSGWEVGQEAVSIAPR